MKKVTYDALYFLFLLGFIIATAIFMSIRRQNFNKKYDITPFWKNPIQNINQVLKNPLLLVFALMFLFFIEKILIRIGVNPRLWIF